MPIYYVAPSGSDSRTKDQAQNKDTPWQTIQHAVRQLQAGDTLLIRGGRYNETVVIPASASGADGKRTKIGAYSSDGGNTFEEVVIDGQYEFPYGSPWWTTGGPSWMTNQYIGYDNGRYYYKPTNDTIYENVGSGKCLVTVEASNLDIEHLTIERSRGCAIGCTNVPTRDNRYRYLELRHIRDRAIRDAGGVNTTWEDCHVWDICNFAQFNRPGSHLNWGVGMGVEINNVNDTYRRCVVHDIWGEGFNPSKTGAEISDCTIYNIWRPAIYLDKCSNVIVRNNLVYQTGKIGNRPINDTHRLFEIGHELYWNPHTSQPHCNDNEIYNNIFINGRFIIWRTPDSFNDPGVFPYPPSALRISDNLVANNTFIDCNVSLQSDSSRMKDNKFFNNVLYNNTGSSSLGSSWSVVSNNCYWRNAPSGLPIGSSDLRQDPVMQDADAPVTAGDVSIASYSLTSASPCIGAGRVAEAPRTDIKGLDRTSSDGKVDIGAHEYAGDMAGVVIRPDFSIDNTSALLTLHFFDRSEPSAAVQDRAWAWRQDNGSWTPFGDGAQNPVLIVETAGLYEIQLAVTNSKADSFTTTRLIEAFDEIVEPGPEANLVINGDFSSNADSWLFLHGGSSAELNIVNGIATIPMTYIVGTTPQLMQSGIQIDVGKTYYLSFDGWVDSGTASPDLLIRQHHEPHTPLGLEERPQLTSERQTFLYRFVATASESDVRLQLMLRFFSGTYHFDNFRLSTTAPETGTIEAAFDIQNPETYVDEAVYFFDRSTASSGITEWAWSANDVPFSTEQNPIFSFENPGSYTIKLTVRGPDGEDSLDKPNAVRISDEVDFPTPLMRIGANYTMRIGAR